MHFRPSVFVKYPGSQPKESASNDPKFCFPFFRQAASFPPTPMQTLANAVGFGTPPPVDGLRIEHQSFCERMGAIQSPTVGRMMQRGSAGKTSHTSFKIFENFSGKEQFCGGGMLDDRDRHLVSFRYFFCCVCNCLERCSPASSVP